MAKRTLASVWSQAFGRSVKLLTKTALRQGKQVAKTAAKQGTRNTQAALRASERATREALQRSGKVAARATKVAAAKLAPPIGPGDWLPGIAWGPAGSRGYYLYRPPAVQLRERLPLVVMLHGCNQDGRQFAESTRMNRLAARQRFYVLYVEQDRMVNPQGCWRWYETRSGSAQAEASTILAAITQVCALHRIDPQRIALVGLSAGAGIAALLATRAPQRFAALVMHSGVAPGGAQSTAGALRTMTLGGAAALPATPEGERLPRLLVLQGDADGVVSPRNADAAAEAWAQALGAAPRPTREVTRGQRRPMTIADWRARGRVVVSQVTVHGLAHAWSGGDARQPFGDPKGPDATRLAWSFIQRAFRDVLPPPR